MAVSARESYLLRTWGISESEYNAILAEQDGGCGMCGRKGVTRSLHVEHDHKTLVIRGLACPACNSGLSKFRDNPEALKRAADFLENPPAVRVLGTRIAKNPPKRRRRRRRAKAKG